MLFSFPMCMMSVSLLNLHQSPQQISGDKSNHKFPTIKWLQKCHCPIVKSYHAMSRVCHLYPNWNLVHCNFEAICFKLNEKDSFLPWTTDMDRSTLAQVPRRSWFFSKFSEKRTGPVLLNLLLSENWFVLHVSLAKNYASVPANREKKRKGGLFKKMWTSISINFTNFDKIWSSLKRLWRTVMSKWHLTCF